MLEFDCPHCGRHLEFDESRRGRPARCPHCQEPFRAPLYDAAPAIPAGRTSGGRSDALLVGATGFAAVGLLLALPVVIMYRAGSDMQLPVPWGLLMATLPLPLAPIGVSWYAAGKTERQPLVWGSRIIGYLWLAAHMYLVFAPLLGR